jgi:hypothetical protein
MKTSLGLTLAALILAAGVLVGSREGVPDPARSATAQEHVFGDVDCTSVVDSKDALQILRLVVGLGVLTVFCSPYDVDCDGRESAVDALKVLRYSAGLTVDQAEPCPNIGTPFST